MRIRIWISVWRERGWLSVWDKVMWHHRLEIPELILAQCLKTTLQHIQVVLKKLLRSLLPSALCKHFFRSGILGAASLLFYSVSLDFAILHFLYKMLPMCWLIRKNKGVINPVHLRRKGQIFLFGTNVWRKQIPKILCSLILVPLSNKQCKLKPLANTLS